MLRRFLLVLRRLLGLGLLMLVLRLVLLLRLLRLLLLRLRLLLLRGLRLLLSGALSLPLLGGWQLALQPPGLARGRRCLHAVRGMASALQLTHIAERESTP